MAAKHTDTWHCRLAASEWEVGPPRSDTSLPNTTFTTLPATTTAPYLNPGCPQASVSLGQTCGNITTVNAVCTTPYSACVSSGATSLPVCRCTGGRVGKSGPSPSCEPAPTSILAAGVNVEYSATVLSNAGVGTSVLNLTRSDLTSFLEVTSPIVQLLPDPGVLRVEVGPGQLEVKVKGLLTPGVTTMALIASATVGGVPVQSVVFLKVTVRPEVARQEVVLLADGSARGTVVFEASRVVPGLQPEAYTLDDLTQVFNVDSSGRVRTTTSLNMSALASKEALTWDTTFAVIARVQNSDVTLARIHVVVTRPRLVTSVEENAARDTVVVRGGPFAQQPPGLPPALQFYGGDVRTTRELDYEHGDRVFTFQLSVVVGGGRTSTTEVVISVTNVNDNPPIVEQALSAVVISGTLAGTPIAELTATDADGDALRYSVRPDALGSLFSVNSGGVLRSSIDMTRDRFGGNFSVEVEVSDGRYILPSTIYIYIVRITTNIASLGRRYSASIFENEAPSEIANLYDSNYAKYEFLEKISSFTINPVNGTVRTTERLDREQRGKHALTIIAVENSDSCSQVFLGILTVRVQDMNDNSPSLAQSSYTARVLEEESNALVLELTAQDADEGSNGRLTFTLQGTGSAYFSLTSTGAKSAQIRTRGRLDRETQPSYQLTVVVTDGGSPSRTASAFLNITVTDRNDNPPRIEPPTSNIYVHENSGASFAYNISYYDPDEGQNGKADLSVVGDSRFYVTTSNELRSNSSLDREERSSHTVLILAADRGSPSLTGTGSVVIIVTDVNDNQPQFVGAMGTSVAEDDSCSSPFFFLTATDRDEGANANVTFRLCPNADATATAALQVDPQGGVRCTTGRLDFETLPLLKLCVEAVDQGTPALTASATLTVTVLDVNDNAPVFSDTSYSVNVSTTEASRGKPLFVASASDKDSGENGKVVYSRVGTDANSFRVEVNSGLVLVGDMDLQAGQYTFSVLATDQGTPPRSSQVSVTVSVSQAPGSTFAFTAFEFNFTVSEDSSVPSNVGPTTANGATSYAIVDSRPPFQINRSSGMLSLVSPLDREITSSYVFVVQAWSASNEKSLAKVQISVEDVNDNAPAFLTSIFYAEVSEDSVAGHHVISISATDADAGINSMLQYSLSSYEAFTIDRASGKVTLSAPLDRERRTDYVITVTVSDKGTPIRQTSQNLTIVVADVNDNAPEVTLPSSVRVRENEVLSHQVLLGSFSDPDLGKNSYVALTVTPTCPLQLAVYDKETGLGTFQLLLNKTLDFETTRNYTCRLEAENDRSNVRLKISREFTILVDDVNDNPPVFEDGTVFTLNVSRVVEVGVQLFPGTRVTDRDTGLNGAINISLQGDKQDYFTVNETSGAIWLHKSLLFPEETILLYLVARNPTDAATSNPNSATATLNVTIEDANVRPYFTRSQHSVNVTEGTAVDSARALQFLLAYDEVEGQTVVCDCNYSIVSVHPSGARGVLDLRQQTGGTGWDLVLTSVLDRENSSTGASMVVVVTAADSGQPPKTGSTTVTIHVLDVNDNGPVFDASPRTVYVKQTEPPGTHLQPAVSATDLDAGENAVTVYQLESFISNGNLSTPFTVNASTGHLVVNGSLSLPEVTSDMSALAVVRATDPGNKLSNVKPVSIVMQYVNPNRAPVFSKAHYTAQVEKNARSSTPINVADFSVTDPDGDTVTVTIVDGNKRDLIAYDKERGFYVQYMLDDTPTLNLTLTAQDRATNGQSLNSTAYLFIRQLDPEPLVCEAQGLYDNNTAMRQNYTILFAVFCAVTALLLLVLIFVIYKWRVAVSVASTNVQPSPYTHTGPSQDDIQKPYTSLGGAVRNPAYSAAGFEGRLDLDDISPYLRVNPDEEVPASSGSQST